MDKPKKTGRPRGSKYSPKKKIKKLTKKEEKIRLQESMARFLDEALGYKIVETPANMTASLASTGDINSFDNDEKKSAEMLQRIRNSESVNGKCHHEGCHNSAAYRYASSPIALSHCHEHVDRSRDDVVDIYAICNKWNRQ